MSGYGDTLTMEALLKTAFPLIDQNSCLIISNKEKFYIFDCDEEKICKITTGRPRILSFEIKNPNLKSLTLLQVDHCLLFDGDGKKCDCIVYDDVYFCFIEFKTTTDSHAARKLARQNAVAQLLASLDLFLEKIGKENFAPRVLEAYLCVGHQPRPAARSNKQAAQRDFAQRNTTLYDGCQKTF